MFIQVPLKNQKIKSLFSYCQRKILPDILVATVSPNNTRRREGVNGPKKCHVLFEWPLMNSNLRTAINVYLELDENDDFKMSKSFI
jgi:hypothetical protein